MERVYLTYLGHSTELPQGETLVGRGLSCRMRFNDPSVSRQHLRLVVKGTAVTLEDLESRNGTFVNCERIDRKTALGSGDRIQIGSRQLELLVEDPDNVFDARTMPFSEMPPVPQQSGAVEQRCPQCDGAVSVEDDLCRHCGYSWGDFRPGAITKNYQVAEPERAERRRHARHRVEVPVLYASDNLTVETVAHNLSKNGVFVRTQILDEEGTECELTILTDGAPALGLRGRVMRVVDRQDAGHPLGLGIEFVDLGPTEKHWLDDIITRLGAAP